jgi:putative tryptophan/tyrosine transport system substrate-binding protein
MRVVAPATHVQDGPLTSRRVFLGTLTGGLLATSRIAEGQQTGKMFRIGYLGPSSPTAVSRFTEAFRQGLRELGWVEGQNIVIEYRFAEGQFDRLPRLAAELARLKVDIIVAIPTPAAVAAKNATATIPIVMTNVADPVGQGLVASLAHPGGNVTGLSYSIGMETVDKSLELLKTAVPSVHRVAVLSNPGNSGHALAIRSLKAAAPSLGLDLQLLAARRPNEIDGAFDAMTKERAGAVLVVADSLFLLHGARLAGLTAKYRLPSMHGVREMVEAGGLMSYGPDTTYQSRHAATYVDKILRGAKPADLPVEQPNKFELVINMKTAKALGLTIPPSLLLRADELIQ